MHPGLTRVQIMAGREIWRKNGKFLKISFFRFFIIKSIKMKSGQHILPIWKGLSVLNTHILIWNEYLWNWGHNTKEYECNFFLIRLYIKYHKNIKHLRLIDNVSLWLLKEIFETNKRTSQKNFTKSINVALRLLGSPEYSKNKAQ